MKHLVTHIRPHLDDICGIWMFKQYHPEFKDAEINFVPLNAVGGVPFNNEPVDSNPDVVHVGVCRGEFDEHGPKHANAKTPESASTIVFKFLDSQGFLPKDVVHHDGLERVVDFVLALDTGSIRGKELFGYTIGAVIQAMNLRTDKSDEDLSWEMFDLGWKMLDGLYISEQDYVQLSEDWKTRKDFEWGKFKGVALTTESKRVDDFAYSKGYDFVVYIDPKNGYRKIRAGRANDVSFEPVYKNLIKIDRDAEWYLHQSKKLLICGHEIAPKTKLSNLSLEELVRIIKES
jgi:hypothetical protein